jgi:hypothetical protein
LTQGLSPLRIRFRVNQIRDSFRLGKIKLPILKSPAGEFSRFRATQPLPNQRVQNCLDDGATAVHVKLRAVLAGITGGSRKPEYQSLIQDLARIGALKLS